ncbi:MAG: hypothetical protein J0H50_01945 [Xanthomonadales bacterium]|nr:hypothetical protein [Xanthomonadales bacterium]
MNTWLLTDCEADDIGPAGGLIFRKTAEAARDRWRHVKAIPFDQSQSAKWGYFRRQSPSNACSSATGAAP